MVFLTFLLVVQAIVAAILVGVILMQQSEGGGLGMGGSPTGLMSARGAADFLTRATTILATVFIGLSILHAVLAARTGGVSKIDTSLAGKGAPMQPLAPAPAPAVDPLAIPTPGAQAPVPQAPPLSAAPEPAAKKAEPAARVDRARVPTRPRVETRPAASKPVSILPAPAPEPVVPAPAAPNGN